MSNEDLDPATPPSDPATQGTTPRTAATLNSTVLFATLQASVAKIVKLGQDTNRLATFVTELDGFEKSLLTLPRPPSADEDSCKSPDPLVAPFCATLDLATATATYAFETGETSAAGDYIAAVDAWDLAVVTYQSALQTANAALRVAVKTAEDAYKSKFNQDSLSRNLILYYSMKADIDTALVHYQSASAAAGKALAAAAGALIAAFAAYATTAAHLESVRLDAVASAQKAFWQSVENARDQI
jgi:hypothetical protein